MQKNKQNKQNNKNKTVLLVVFTMILAMTGLSFASVPLYSMFCRVTGFGGTTQVSEKAPDHILDRQVTIKFNADTNPKLPWLFKPD